MLKTLRINKKTLKEEHSIRYFISSLSSPYPKALLTYIRQDWAIENSLHPVLDVVFKEDSCRSRINNSAENLALIRRFAFNLIKSKNKDKMSMKKKILRGNWDLDYLKNLLVN